MATKTDLIKAAQTKLNEAIELLEIICKDDGNAKAYVLDRLKIICSNKHWFLSKDLNLDHLIERYKINKENVGGDELLINNYLNLLEKALLDILDGTSPNYLQLFTGLNFKRCMEIVNIIPIITEQRKTNETSS